MPRGARVWFGALDFRDRVEVELTFSKLRKSGLLFRPHVDLGSIVGLDQGTPVGDQPSIDQGLPLDSSAMIWSNISQARADDIVQIRSRTQLICSGTIVFFEGRRWLLTAAHCLFSQPRDGRRALRTDLTTNEGPLDSGAAWFAPGFVNCFAAGARFEDCLFADGGDIALVPLFGDSSGGVTVPCEAEGFDSMVQVYGYGLDRGVLPGRLLFGVFKVAHSRSGLTLAASVESAMVNSGDSGGPGFSMGDLSCTAWVSSAVIDFGDGERRAALVSASATSLRRLRRASW